MKKIEVKTPIFQRDLGTLVAITSFTLIHNPLTQDTTANARYQIDGLEKADLFTSYYGYHRANIVGNSNCIRDDSHEDLIAIETPERLWKMPVEELEALTLRYEYKYMEKKVNDWVRDSVSESTVIDYFPRLPFYLRAVQGYAQLVGDDSWATDKAKTKAQEGFNGLCCWLRPYFEDIVSKKERKVVCKSIFIDTPEAAANSLAQDYGIEIKPRLRELRKIYQKGVDEGTIITNYP